MYDEVTRAVWDNTPNAAFLDTDFNQDDDLLYIGRLVSHLISETGSLIRNDARIKPGGYRLEEVHRSFAVPDVVRNAQSAKGSTTAAELAISASRKVGHLDPGGMLSHWQPRSAEVMLLMAGAIFGVILVFMLRK